MAEPLGVFALMFHRNLIWKCVIGFCYVSSIYKKKEQNFYVDVTQVDILVSIARECIVLNIEMKGLRNASKLEVHWMCILLTVCPILQRNPSLERSFLKVDVVNCKIIRWVLDWSIYDRDRSIQIEFRWKSHFPFMQIVIFTLVQASRVD